MSEKLSIAKLRGAENYAAWSADLRLILRRDKNWSLVEGVDAKPPIAHIPDPSFTPPPSNTDLQPPTIQNPDCEEVVKRHIRHLEVPATVWQTLRDLYEPKGASMQSTLVKKIFRTTLADYTSISEYLAAVETGAADYIAAGPYGCPVIPDHLLALAV